MNAAASCPRAPNGLRRVVITGMGAVTSLGGDVDEIWRAVLAGRSGVAPIRLFDASAFPVRIGSEVPPELIAGQNPRLPRAIQFGYVAGDKAWREAGLASDAGPLGARIDPARIGVCVGASCFPALEDWVTNLSQLIDGDRIDRAGYRERLRERPDLVHQQDMATVSSFLSTRFGARGLSLTVQTACASATQAIGESYRAIARNDADIVLSGGTDSLVSIICLTGFSLLNALSSRECDAQVASRPFDRDRDGFVLGEGAGLVVLEDLEHALRRGATIRGEVIGYGSSSDGFRFTDMHPEGRGAARCMQAALDSARIEPTAVGYINAHGTSTLLNDRIETLAIKHTFGAHASRLAISSTKSQLGHLICAAGGLELILTVLALENGLLPPTINLDHPDPDCDLDYIPYEPRPSSARVALSNSFGFGGQNGTLVVQRWQQE
jgi:3-oxoacyl-[acyl-carrier-protein] synthase II